MACSYYMTQRLWADTEFSTRRGTKLKRSSSRKRGGGRDDVGVVYVVYLEVHHLDFKAKGWGGGRGVDTDRCMMPPKFTSEHDGENYIYKLI